MTAIAPKGVFDELWEICYENEIFYCTHIIIFY